MAQFTNMKALSGYRGRVMIQSSSSVTSADTSILATKWSLTYKTELQDCSTFEEVTGTSGSSVGANTPISRYVASMTDMDVSIDAFYDVNNGWMPTLRPGTEMKAVLYINKPSSEGSGNKATTNVADNSTERKVSINFIIENVTYDVEVRGVVKFSLTGKVSGGTALSFV